MKLNNLSEFQMQYCISATYTICLPALFLITHYLVKNRERENNYFVHPNWSFKYRSNKLIVAFKSVIDRNHIKRRLQKLQDQDFAEFVLGINWQLQFIKTLCLDIVFFIQLVSKTQIMSTLTNPICLNSSLLNWSWQEHRMTTRKRKNAILHFIVTIFDFSWLFL